MAKKAPEETESPVVSGTTVQCKVLGVGYTLTGVPNIPDEYPGGAAACLKRAIAADIAHSFNAKARSALVDAIEAELKEQGVPFEERTEDQTEQMWVKKLVDNGTINDEFLNSLPPISLEYTLGSTRTGVNAHYKKLADGLIAKYGDNPAVAAERLQASLAKSGIDESKYKVLATKESIAMGFKVRDEADDV